MWQEFQLPTEAQFLHLQAFGMTSTKDDFPRSTEGMRLDAKIVSLGCSTCEND